MMEVLERPGNGIVPDGAIKTIHSPFLNPSSLSQSRLTGWRGCAEFQRRISGEPQFDIKENSTQRHGSPIDPSFASNIRQYHPRRKA